MDHKLAEQENAVERYLLNEFTPAERMEFEEHLFDCRICAEQARQDAIFADNVKAVMLEEERSASRGRSKLEKGKRIGSWFQWFRPATLVPAFAALAFAAILGYQNLVYIPGLEQPQVLSTTVIAPLARDEGAVVKVDRRLPRFNLNFEVDSPRPYPAYRCDFEREDGARVLSLDSGPRQVASFTLDLLLPTKRFPPGRYVMILRSNSEPQREIQRYTFVIQDGGSTP